MQSTEQVASHGSSPVMEEKKRCGLPKDLARKKRKCKKQEKDVSGGREPSQTVVEDVAVMQTGK